MSIANTEEKSSKKEQGAASEGVNITPNKTNKPTRPLAGGYSRGSVHTPTIDRK